MNLIYQQLGDKKSDFPTIPVKQNVIMGLTTAETPTTSHVTNATGQNIHTLAKSDYMLFKPAVIMS